MIKPLNLHPLTVLLGLGSGITLHVIFGQLLGDGNALSGTLVPVLSSVLGGWAVAFHAGQWSGLDNAPDGTPGVVAKQLAVLGGGVWFAIIIWCGMLIVADYYVDIFLAAFEFTWPTTR